MSFDKAPSSRSNCYFCDSSILINSFRVDYRIKESTSLRDQKRAHVECCDKIPEWTRASDRAKVRRWLGDPSLEPEWGPVLEGVLRLLT